MNIKTNIASSLSSNHSQSTEEKDVLLHLKTFLPIIISSKYKNKTNRCQTHQRNKNPHEKLSSSLLSLHANYSYPSSIIHRPSVIVLNLHSNTQFILYIYTYIYISNTPYTQYGNCSAVSVILAAPLDVRRMPTSVHSCCYNGSRLVFF